MNSISKTLYIPLYGKSFVSKKGVIIKDRKAEEIWSKEGFKLKGKSKSKWLAYYLAIRAAVYDEWLKKEIKDNSSAIVLHIGCGMDSRVCRVSMHETKWYDIDFADVIKERRKYFEESDYYHMLSADMRTNEWKKYIESNRDAIIVLEGVSMYFNTQELIGLLSNIAMHFKSVKILMDCYTEKSARLSKYKNPINDVGVRIVYGYDHPEELAERSNIVFVREHNITPQKYIDELYGLERTVFKRMFAGKISKSMYKMYEFEKRLPQSH